MTEEIKPDVIKKTQETLGKFIKKPTLTEKLLKKPPFRFLHDICTSVTKETGFFEGVLNEEDQFENIKDKEGKILFLQKVITAVEAATGVKLGVRPNKVVAGLEATKTNEFLQALGKALEKQQVGRKSSRTSLQPVKAKSTKKVGKEVKEEPPTKKKSSGRTSKKIVDNGGNENDDNKNKTDVPPPESPKKKHSSKKVELAPSRESADKWEEECSINKNLNNGFVEKNGEQISRKSSAVGAGESKDLLDVSIIRVNGADGQGDENLMSKEETTDSGEPREVHTGKHKHRHSAFRNVPDQAKETDRSETNEDSDRTKRGNSENVTINTKNKSEFQNKTTPSIQGPLNYSTKDTNLVREGTLISRPRTGIRPTTARPASARPAAPRIRDRSDVAVSEEVMKPASGKIQVIADEEAVNEADEEALISLETTNDTAKEEPMPVSPAENHKPKSEHGHLVEQILEIQRELEADAKFSEHKGTGKTEIEWESFKSKESANREIEKLRGSIQALTRTANPLGKLLDFFQEDFDIVQKELESWRDKNASFCSLIEQEKIVTEQYVQPLKIHLKEIQKNIDEQLDQISIVKANIIRNNEKISKLLSGM